MQKLLRFLGLAAVIGAVGIVIAQRSAGAPRSGNQTHPQSPAATASSSKFANNVVILLSQYFCSRQQFEIDRAKENGRQSRVDAIIRANCSANLWLLTPEQQKIDIAGMEIEKYRGTDPLWAEVARSPSLVDSLLQVDPAIDAKVEKLIDAVWQPIRDMDKEFELQLLASDEWKNAKTQHERNVLHYEKLKIYRQSHPLPPLIERQTDTLARYKSAIESTRTMLKPAQLAEMNSLIKRFETAMNGAVNGTRP